MTDAPAFFPILQLMERAVDISVQTRHNIYDCLYVALAEQEGCEFITSDEKLMKNLQSTFAFIVPLSSLKT